MAVPVIGVVSKTKSAITVKKSTWTSATSLGATFPQNTAGEDVPLRVIGAVDGDYISLVFSAHNGTGYGGTMQAIGVTSNTVIHTYTAGDDLKNVDYGFRNILKNTGVTEDVKFVMTTLSTAFHSGGGAYSIHSPATCNFVDVLNGTSVTIKQTMQIDSINMIALAGSAGNTQTCPSVGYRGGGSTDRVYTHTPNKMVNELTFNAGGTETADNNINHNVFVYSYTGKELSMS